MNGRPAELRRLIERYQRRLAKLKEAKAVSGLQTAPDVEIEIEDIENEIETLRGQLEAVENEPSVGRILATLRQSIADLEVTDPRLELLRRQLFDLSIMVDELQERVRQIEKHEEMGLQVARAVAFAGFVVLVVVVSRYI